MVNALRLIGTQILVVCVGCTATTVKKDPGPHDCGLRYYRPKPYLLLEPASVESKAVPNMVKITLHWLPDFSEEYSIHVRAGFGTNKTVVTLDKGWNLTDLDVKVDSKTDENITALAGLLGKFKPTGGQAVARSRTVANSVPAAHNVPLGFYEATISNSPDGKRLHTWRYVGFAPFSPCPICPTGGPQPADCCAGQVFGLVSEDGMMMFKLLPTIEQTPVEEKAGILSRVKDAVIAPLAPVVSGIHGQWSPPAAQVSPSK